MSGLISSPQAQTLIFCELVKTATRVTSAPVPAVVGMAMIGRRFLGNGTAAN